MAKNGTGAWEALNQPIPEADIAMEFIYVNQQILLFSVLFLKLIWAFLFLAT